MKLKITIFIVFFLSLTYGQTYNSLISEAEGFYKNKEYKKSVEKYVKAFKLERNNFNDLYNASCSAALTGNNSVAFSWLNQALKKGWLDITHLQSDADLSSLHQDRKWSDLLLKIRASIAKIEAGYDKPLQKKLLAILNDDQDIRNQYIAAQKEFGYQSKQVDSLAGIAIYKDSINLLKVTEILDHKGWVGPDKVVETASKTIFLVIQHSDLKTQQKYLPMMRKAVKKKKVSSASLALLEDRVALREGKKQIFGSQISFDAETKKNYVLPLEDPDNVDKRRAAVGLGPLSDYVKRWGIDWSVNDYKKELPLIIEKQNNAK